MNLESHILIENYSLAVLLFSGHHSDSDDRWTVLEIFFGDESPVTVILEQCNQEVQRQGCKLIQRKRIIELVATVIPRNWARKRGKINCLH